MNPTFNTFGSLLVAVSIGAVGLSAQSCAAPNHVSTAAAHSAEASRELGKAGLQSGAATVKVAAGVVAVPVMLSGVSGAAVGSSVSALGDSTTTAGEDTRRAGEKIWDFANGNPDERPPLDRKRSIPATPKSPPSVDLPPRVIAPSL
jgi:hypothetical protein